MLVRRLSAADAGDYRELMLEAYSLAADAFTSTAEERAAKPESWWIKRIASPDTLGTAFGAYEAGELVGAVALEFSDRPKRRHSAALLGMYVRARARSHGAGSALLAAAIEHVRHRPGLKVITLTVTADNEAAIRLYQAAGFMAWGTEPMAILTPRGLKNKVHMWRPVADEPRTV